MEDETFPDIGSMSDEELKELIDNLTAEEQEQADRNAEDDLSTRVGEQHGDQIGAAQIHHTDDTERKRPDDIRARPGFCGQ